VRCASQRSVLQASLPVFDGVPVATLNLGETRLEVVEVRGQKITLLVEASGALGPLLLGAERETGAPRWSPIETPANARSFQVHAAHLEARSRYRFAVAARIDFAGLTDWTDWVWTE
jgi:hypothetical protein